MKLLKWVIGFALLHTTWANNLVSKLVRIQQELVSPYEPLKLTGETYELFTSAPRNYSLHVVLTALSPEHKCEPCR
jgi:hypothetical protein